jgi:hypothetical protein
VKVQSLVVIPPPRTNLVLAFQYDEINAALFEADGGGKAGGSRTDDDYLEHDGRG